MKIDFGSSVLNIVLNILGLYTSYKTGKLFLGIIVFQLVTFIKKTSFASNLIIQDRQPLFATNIYSDVFSAQKTWADMSRSFIDLHGKLFHQNNTKAVITQAREEWRETKGQIGGSQRAKTSSDDQVADVQDENFEEIRDRLLLESLGKEEPDFFTTLTEAPSDKRVTLSAPIIKLGNSHSAERQLTLIEVARFCHRVKMPEALQFIEDHPEGLGNVDENGNTALMIVIDRLRYNWDQKPMSLAQKMADKMTPEQLNLKNRYGATALSLAEDYRSRSEFTEIRRKLIRVMPETEILGGKTKLILAIEVGEMDDVIQELVPKFSKKYLSSVMSTYNEMPAKTVLIFIKAGANITPWVIERAILGNHNGLITEYCSWLDGHPNRGHLPGEFFKPVRQELHRLERVLDSLKEDVRKNERSKQASLNIYYCQQLGELAEKFNAFRVSALCEEATAIQRSLGVENLVKSQKM